MPIKKKIDVMCAYAGISQAELARRIGLSPANLNQKIMRGSIKYDELCRIAHAADCDLIFITRDGKTI